uniref:hypothetical protein n=1 Tax=Phocaeicola dorei TaxID=357276 RepID=UPI004025DD32
MEKLKKYFKMIVDEIAEQELHHKEVLEKTVKQYIDACKNESGESCADMEVVFDFVKDVSESMVEPIRAKLK